MHRWSTRSAGLTAALAAVAMLSGACGGSDTPAASTATTLADSPTTVKEAPLSATLNGSGSTFMKGFVEVAIAEIGRASCRERV